MTEYRPSRSDMTVQGSRDDSEHEQILIRIAIGVVIAVILGGVLLLGSPSPSLILCSWLAGFLLVSALGFLMHEFWKPGVNPTRRCAAMVLDIGCLSAGMILGGELMTPLYPLFLWVIFGMGFRYGRRYLLISAIMGLLGFGTVVVVSEYWRSQPLLAGSLLLALIILPAYTSTLLKRLTEALEKAETANRAKSRFLATMSHELRTPLNAIFGMSDLLEADRLNANQRDMITTVRSAGHTLLELIDDLLDVARIESGRLQPSQDRFDLHVTLSVVMRLLRHQAQEKGLELRARYEPAIPQIVFGTERWLKQILVNLIGNAIKFTSQGTILLEVHVQATGDGRADLVFEVADTGIGIPAEAQDKIFERFAQADDGINRRHSGSGLGLSIARQLAEIMGGTLTVESSVGEGARFSLTMSFETSTDAPGRLSGRVAIVGDDDKAQAYAARLQAWGAETSIASHPSEVFGYLENCGQLRAVLLLDDGKVSASAAFSEQLRSWFRGETLNQVLIFEQGLSEVDKRPYLSTLAEETSDDLLFNIMHAALAAPGPLTDDRTTAPATIGSRILVAEDNAVNQRVIQKILASGGHSTVLVSDGEALLDRLEDDDFDLVLVDLNMPLMSGLDAVKLHRLGAGTDHPPFVALTADATEEARQACLEIGFADYLTKPIEMRDVLDVVQRLSKTGQAEDHATVTKVIRHPRFVDSQAAIDLNYLRNLRTLDPDPAFFVQIVNDFIDDASGLLDELEAAAEKADDIMFRDRNHALQSSAAYIGGVGLCQLCQQSRHVGPDQLRQEGPGKVDGIRREFRRLCLELRALTGEGTVAGKEGSI